MGNREQVLGLNRTRRGFNCARAIQLARYSPNRFSSTPELFNPSTPTFHPITGHLTHSTPHTTTPLQLLSTDQYRRNGQGRCGRKSLCCELLAPVHGTELTIIFNSKARRPCTYRLPSVSASFRRPSSITFRSHWIRGMAAGIALELAMGAVPYFFRHHS